jgi:hypothetical protein
MPAQAISPSEENISQGMPRIVWRVFSVFGILAILSLALYLFGSFYGERMSHAGHSTDETVLSIFIGNDGFELPANMIRHADQRISGSTSRLDIYVHWPSQSGYSTELAPAFREADPKKIELVMAGLAKRRSFLDMADRFQPVYLDAIDQSKIKKLKNGLYVAPLLAEYGYVNEKVVYSLAAGTDRPEFIARCQLSTGDGPGLLLPCETDIFIGNNTEAKFRFATSRLVEWQRFSKELSAFADRISAGK